MVAAVLDVIVVNAIGVNTTRTGYNKHAYLH